MALSARIPTFTSDPYSGALVALDFPRQFHKAPGYRGAFAGIPNLTVSRASVGYAERLDGTLQLFPANTARITDRGLLVEESRTKKNTNRNLNPQNTTGLTKSGDAASVLSVVDDSAALAAIGLTGNVYKLDNSAGTTTAFANLPGTVGNLNPHTVSAYVRGSGTARVELAGAVGASISLGSSYVRRASTHTPDLTSRPGVIAAMAGAVVYFVCEVLEEGSFVTSPILDAVGGSTATRGADNISVGGLGAALTAPFTARVWWSIPSLDGVDSRAMSLSDGTNSNRVEFQRNASNQAFTFMVAGGAGQSNPGNVAGRTGARRLKEAVRVRSGAWNNSLDGALGTSQSITNPTGVDVLKFGSSTGTERPNGYIELVTIQGDTTDSAFQALTA